MRISHRRLASAALGILSVAVYGRATFAVCSMDAKEGFDACRTSAAIRGGEIQARNFCENEEDWAQFNACAGKVYVIRTSNLGPAADTALEIESQNCGGILAFDDNSGGGLASKIIWSPTSSGRYHVRVRQADGSFGPDRGYELRIEGDTSSCETFARRYSYSGPAAPPPASVATSDGGELLVFNNTTAPNRGTEPTVVRLTAVGSIVWSEKIGSGLSESVTKAFETSDGGFVLAGVISQGATCWIAKLTDYGSIAWQRAYGFGGVLRDVRPTPDGGFVMAWQAEDVTLAKLDPVGSLVWIRRYDGSPPSSQYDDKLLDLAATPDGGVVILGSNGYSWPFSPWLARLDSTGAVLWSRALDVSLSSVSGAVALMDDGGVALAASLSNGTNQPPVEKIAVERFDGSGQGMWGRTLSGTSAPELLSATSDGGMVLMTMASDGFLVRFDATGAPLWTKHVYPSTDLDPSPDGGVRVAGASGGYVLQADENGEIQACSASQDAGVTIEAASPGSTPKTIVVTPGTAIPDILVVQLASAPPPSRTDDCSCRMPLYSGTLTVEKVANVPRVAWSSGGSMRYDVVMGRLSVLEATGGNFTAALDAVAGGACLAQDTTLLQITDGSLVPAPGDGAFYLVRGVEPNCLLGGSFDDPVLPGQVAGRDVAIRASSGSCP